jgi:hypothetical protein
MRTAFLLVFIVVLSWSVSMELSWDIGPTVGLVCTNPSFLGASFPLPTGGPWYLTDIKYYVYLEDIPHGYGVACWKMESIFPGEIVWPESGVPEYDPNTDGNWIIHNVDPMFDVTTNCPNGFMIGIATLYYYPNSDVMGEDNQGPNIHNWINFGMGWQYPSTGRFCERAIINDLGTSVQTTTLGCLRAIYR